MRVTHGWKEKTSLLVYFLFTFGWTWLMVLILILTGQTDVNNPSVLFILMGLLSNIAPSIAAAIVTNRESKENITKSLKDQFKTRSSATFYIFTPLIVPIITLLTILISHFIIRPYSINIQIPLIIMGLIWPLFSGFGEEFGWRGYILPKLLKKMSPLIAGLLLGSIWAIWHFPMWYLGYQTYGTYMVPAFVLVSLNLVLNTLIMTHIYIISQQNIKLMIIYHYTITGSSILFGAIFTAENLPKFIVLESIITCTLLLIVVIIIYLWRAKTQKSTQPLTSENPINTA